MPPCTLTQSVLVESRSQSYAASLASAKQYKLCAPELECVAPPLYEGRVELIPLRRAWGVNGLREQLMLPRGLTPALNTALIQVKHTLLDFARLQRNYNVVPGDGIVGKLVTHGERFSSQELVVARRPAKYFVYPHSACWVQRTAPCANCREVMYKDIHDYDVHRRWPCLALWTYGDTIDGGFQSYVHVVGPEHILVEIPPSVSLHDVCFLGQVAVPFYAYCVDVLAEAIALAPAVRILVVLSDAEREANDCLLVCRHLGYEHVRMTFTDPKSLAACPELRHSYRGQFGHVLVFARGPTAVEMAVDLGMAADLQLEIGTLALFNGAGPAPQLSDRAVHQVRLSYKDKFLFEALLHTLKSFNIPDATRLADLRDLCASGPNPLASATASDREAARTETALKLAHPPSPAPRKGHVSWLYCDMDLNICTDDACSQGSHCQLTASVNDMVYSNCALRRVFYTYRLTCASAINACIL